MPMSQVVETCGDDLLFSKALVVCCAPSSEFWFMLGSFCPLSVGLLLCRRLFSRCFREGRAFSTQVGDMTRAVISPRAMSLLVRLLLLLSFFYTAYLDFSLLFLPKVFGGP